MKLKILTYLFDNALIVLSTVAGIITAAFSFWIIYQGDNYSDKNIYDYVIGGPVLWLLLSAPIFFVVGGIGAPVYMIITHYKLELQKERNNPGHLEEEKRIRRLARHDIIKKLFKPVLVGIILYIPCALIFNSIPTENPTSIFIRSIAAVLLWFPLYISLTFLYLFLKWLKRKDIIRRPKITKRSLIIGAATYLICAVLLAVANPDRDLDSEYLSATTTIWVFLQLAMIFIYFIFRLTMRLFRSSH